VALFPLTRYSPSPLVLTALEIVTFFSSRGNPPSSLLNVIETNASSAFFSSSVPENIRSDNLSPLIDFADILPTTKQIASVILDLPLPLGPTTQVKPLERGSETVLLPYDLNPFIVTFSMNTMEPPLE